MCFDLISCFSYMICLGGCFSECKEMYAFCFHWVRISWRCLLISFDLWSSLILLPFCIILLFYFLRIVFCLKAGSHFVTPDGLELRINPSTSDSWLLRSHVWTTIVDWGFIDWLNDLHDASTGETYLLHQTFSLSCSVQFYYKLRWTIIQGIFLMGCSLGYYVVSTFFSPD